MKFKECSQGCFTLVLTVTITLLPTIDAYIVRRKLSVIYERYIRSLLSVYVVQWRAFHSTIVLGYFTRTLTLCHSVVAETAVK